MELTKFNDISFDFYFLPFFFKNFFLLEAILIICETFGFKTLSPNYTWERKDVSQRSRDIFLKILEQYFLVFTASSTTSAWYLFDLTFKSYHEWNLFWIGLAWFPCQASNEIIIKCQKRHVTQGGGSAVMSLNITLRLAKKIVTYYLNGSLS